MHDGRALGGKWKSKLLLFWFLLLLPERQVPSSPTPWRFGGASTFLTREGDEDEPRGEGIRPGESPTSWMCACDPVANS